MFTTRLSAGDLAIWENLARAHALGFAGEEHMCHDAHALFPKSALRMGPRMPLMHRVGLPHRAGQARQFAGHVSAEVLSSLWHAVLEVLVK